MQYFVRVSHWIILPCILLIYTAMTEPLSAEGTGYPVINLFVMCVTVSMKTTLIIHTSKFINFHDTYLIFGNPFSGQP